MATDLMYRDEIKTLVRDAYQRVRAPDGPATRYYDSAQLETIPDEARRWALGVGNPVRHARPRPGETLVDLGCGSGIDVLLAATDVGESGHAIGVDFLPSMIERAERLADEAGLDNVAFERSEIEDIDLPDASVDVVTANGSINLCARKSRAFAEAHRVLRPGGRICVADPTVVEEELPPEIITHPSAWAG